MKYEKPPGFYPGNVKHCFYVFSMTATQCLLNIAAVSLVNNKHSMIDSNIYNAGQTVIYFRMGIANINIHYKKRHFNFKLFISTQALVKIEC